MLFLVLEGETRNCLSSNKKFKDVSLLSFLCIPLQPPQAEHHAHHHQTGKERHVWFDTREQILEVKYFEIRSGFEERQGTFTDEKREGCQEMTKKIPQEKRKKVITCISEVLQYINRHLFLQYNSSSSKEEIQTSFPVSSFFWWIKKYKKFQDHSWFRRFFTRIQQSASNWRCVQRKNFWGYRKSATHVSFFKSSLEEKKDLQTLQKLNNSQLRFQDMQHFQRFSKFLFLQDKFVIIQL